MEGLSLKELEKIYLPSELATARFDAGIPSNWRTVGTLPLEASVTAYRRGAELVKFCNVQLEQVDQQVKMLEGDVLKPLFPALSPADSGE